MIKKFLVLLAFTGIMNASLVNAVAVIVNNSVITLYDIDVAMQEKNLSHNQALGMLIDEVLYKEELKKLNIKVEDFEIDDYVIKLATSNQMDLEEFRKAVEQSQDYKSFLEDTKKRLLSQKLISKIASGKLAIATEDDMKIYYDNNIEQFKLNKNSIQVVSFDKVKEKIFSVIMKKREDSFLKEYFESLKITADIKMVR